MPFVSVIIPVYNVEKYLKQCVDSVLNQKIDDMEIILVDDGSPDSCPMICDRYAEEFDCVHVIHKKNGGLSSARNEGIKAAKGEYLIFLDSDDWWNPEVNVKDLLNKVRQYPDIEMFLFTSYDFVEGVGLFKRSEHRYLKDIRTDNVENYYQDLLNNGNLEISASTKILKKDFLIDGGLYFCEGLLSEDNQWMLRLLRKLHSVKILDEPLYIYRAFRKDSITYTIKRKNITDLLEIVKESIEYYDKNDCAERLKLMELCYASYLWFSALGLSSTLSRAERKEITPLFKTTSIVCDYSNSRKTKMCRYVMKIFGFELTTMILGVYIRIKGKFHLNKVRLNMSVGESKEWQKKH